MEPRAALGDYDSGTETYTLYTTSQNPHVARLVISAFIGIAPENKLRVIAPDVGGGFGSKIFIYAEETVCVWAAKKVGRPVKWTADRTEAFLSDAHGRDHVTHAELALDDERQDHRRCGSTPSPISAPICRPSRPRCRPISTRRCCRASTTSRRSMPRSTRSTPTPRRSMPIAAPAARRRPIVVERMVEIGGARARAATRPKFRRKNFITQFPHQTPVIMTYDAGDYDASLDKALELADYKGFARAQARLAPQAASCAASAISAYIEACGIAPSAAVGSLGAGVGLWESAEVRVNPVGTVEVLTGSHSHGQGHETTFAQLVSDRLGIPIDTGLDRPRRHRQGAVRHGHLRLALGRGRHVGDRQGARQDRCQGQEGRRPRAGGRRGRHRVQGRQASRSRAPTRDDFGEVALQAYIAHKFSGQELEPGLKEGAFYDPTNFTFPAGVHICEVEIDPETGVTDDRAVDGGRRFRQAHQPDDRRGPGAWRHRPGRRPGAARRRALRQGRASSDGELHGLLHAARRRPAVVQGRHDRDAPARPTRSASRAAARPARSPRRRRSSTRSPTRSATRTCRCRRRRRSSGALAQASSLRRPE